MPTYEYQCSSCGHVFDAVQKISEPALTKCSACGKDTAKRLISATAFHLKGGGWYKTDYSSSSASSSSSSDKATSSSDACSQDKTAEKPSCTTCPATTTPTSK